MKECRMKYRNRIAAAGTAAVLAMLMLAGCEKKPSPQELLADVQKNISDIESIQCNLGLDAAMSLGEQSYSVGMDIDMDYIEKTETAHIKGNVSMNISGMDLGTDVEIYQVKEDQEYVMYTLMQGQWSKSIDENMGSAGKEILFNFDDGSELFEVTASKAKINGKSCYKLEGKIRGEALEKLLEDDMMRSVSGMDIGSEEMLEAQLPCTIWIYRDSILPAKLSVDMKDIVKSAAGEPSEGYEISECRVEITFLKFNSLDKIEVPQEALEAAGQGELRKFETE